MTNPWKTIVRGAAVALGTALVATTVGAAPALAATAPPGLKAVYRDDHEAYHEAISDAPDGCGTSYDLRVTKTEWPSGTEINAVSKVGVPSPGHPFEICTTAVRLTYVDDHGFTQHAPKDGWASVNYLTDPPYAYSWTGQLASSPVLASDAEAEVVITGYSLADHTTTHLDYLIDL